MKPLDLLRLLALAAIWGSSFLFMRVLSPLLGPALTATIRTLAAGLLLTGLFALLRVRLGIRQAWRRYVLIGLLNSALPFFLFSWAALSLPGPVSALINALTPIWGALFARLFLGERLGARRILGLALGFAGVAGVVLAGLLADGGAAARGGLGSAGILPPMACLLATACYGLAGVYTRKKAADLAPRSITAVSLLAAGLALLPLALLAPRPAAPAPAWAWGLALVFSLLCSGIAYLLYFGLIASAGVTRALSVTLLIPVFALGWGFLVLGETVSLPELGGGLLALGGTWLVGKGPAASGARSGKIA